MRPFFNTERLNPRRSSFDLSYSNTFDCDMGYLIPVQCDEVVPGDVWRMSNQIVVRLQPLVAPVLAHVDVVCHTFFVPYRLLWEDFEEFITGGRDGDYNGLPPMLSDYMETFPNSKYTILDFLGFPVGNIPLTEDNSPVMFPVFAYNKIWNEYFRDQNLQDEVAEEQISLLRRAWEKDYYTSALPFVQRGTIPALPVETFIDGDLSVGLVSTANTHISQHSTDPLSFTSGANVRTGHPVTPFSTTNTPNPYYLGNTDLEGNVIEHSHLRYAGGLVASTEVSTSGQVDNDLSILSTAFNVNDLRTAYLISLWQERNARSGVRYTEFLRAHFGVAPRDDRLDRPEYIGGTRSPVIVSEVLQTSSTDTTSPQGNLAGHGITVDSNFIGSYRVQEYGLIMTMFSIIPKPSYKPQGVARQWTRKSRFGFYSPEFANLGEQAILNKELYTTGTSDDEKVFGYQGRFDEMRVKQNMVSGSMRDTFDYWHLAREFDGLPYLNESFIECNPPKRMFAVQNEPGFIVNYGAVNHTLRPLPAISIPGWM